jgi:hypothetical protein
MQRRKGAFVVQKHELHHVTVPSVIRVVPMWAPEFSFSLQLPPSGWSKVSAKSQHSPKERN